MQILLLGCTGQVGWELQRSLSLLGNVTALSRCSENGRCGDLNQPEALVTTVRQLAPDVIVNAAAYTAVDQAESEPELAEAINTNAPAVLAAEA
ncbi:MAG: sugar nucleotide-binding protein, partial [Chloroflexota bacterium]|nr:sugar nucleotide-binding protein [Chloroflexota bacterium]